MSLPKRKLIADEETLTHRSAGRAGIMVTHPGTQHSYETALGVQEAGMLHSYWTGFYHRPGSFLNRAVAAMPAKLRTRLDRELKRRFKSGLNPSLVRTAPFWETVFVASERIVGSENLVRRISRLRNDRFDQKIARTLSHETAQAVLCYDGSALDTFRAAERLGMFRVLDQSIAHCRVGMRLLEEEAEMHPEFADSMVVGPDPWRVNRYGKEPKLANLILVASEFVRDSLIDDGVDAARIAILPYGADINRFSPTPRQQNGKTRVLFVGQIEQRKGIKYLLEAIKGLDRKEVELTLLGDIIGSGKGLMPYREYFNHVPSVPHHEVHKHFATADLFVFPSLYEGSARVIYEALASGLPVVTTPNSGSVVRDGTDGFIVPIRSVEALQQKIQLLMRDRNLRTEMGRNARTRALEFTWENYRKRLGALLRSAMEQEQEAA